MFAAMVLRDGPVKASFLRDSGGKPTGILGVTRDITKRKRGRGRIEDKITEP